MKRSLLVVFLALSSFTALAQSPAPTKPSLLAHTFSIVARDPATGEIGVAVQSHWFSVGSVVPWAEAGVGAVATQSFVDPSYGKLGLELMKAGRSAPDALRGLVAADPGRDVRQVAMIDAEGRVMAHTGGKCVASAGQNIDEKNQFSVQANMMIRPAVMMPNHPTSKPATGASRLAEAPAFSPPSRLISDVPLRN